MAVPKRKTSPSKRHMRRSHHALGTEARAPDVEVPVEGDEDTPEVLSGTLIDLAAPLLEELSLGLDPYPRAKGVTFESPKDEAEPEETPFAVLAKLKQRPPGKPEPRK